MFAAVAYNCTDTMEHEMSWVPEWLYKLLHFFLQVISNHDISAMCSCQDLEMLQRCISAPATEKVELYSGSPQ
jgi:hypothetical protein